MPSYLLSLFGPCAFVSYRSLCMLYHLHEILVTFLECIVALHFHVHQINYQTTSSRELIQGLHVFVIQSHTLNAEGQGQCHEFGAKK